MARLKLAFTLIELLVVIAIIAILAAILFPVFAQAKLAAKKTASLSQIKQVGTATHLYLIDNDDTYPLAAGKEEEFGYYGFDLLYDVPADLHGQDFPEFVPLYEQSWANSTMPYLKNKDMLTIPGAPVKDLFKEGYQTGGPQATPGLTYNGLLHAYPAGGVTSPSNLIMYSMGNGNENYQAYAVSNPFLICNNGDQECSYVPSTSGCDQNVNGGTSALFQVFEGSSMWVYGNGMNIAFADTSAKYRKVGMNLNGKTDFRSDFYSHYDNTGRPFAQWRDTNACHSLLFQPDFDFSNWGNPLEVFQ